MAQSVTNYGTAPVSAGRCGPAVTSRLLELRLDSHEVRKLGGNQCGTQILSVNSVLWVTQDGDLQDYVLCPGDRFTVTQPGPVVIQGM
jgi:hypothetical protein